ncbi:MAG: hypothetical protein JO293_06675 [Candidatus Eremiobacteraeota bacterium]|nr:hypothetical protein [Candidatus Eremiobacteraeota bacterium]
MSSPLEPRLTVGGVLRRAFGVYTRNWLPVMILYAAFMGPALVLEYLLGSQSETKFLEARTMSFGLFGLPASLEFAMSTFEVGTKQFLYDQFDGLLGAVLLPLAVGGVVNVVSAALLGERSRIGSLFRITFDNWLGYAQIGLLWYITLLAGWYVYNATIERLYEMSGRNDVATLLLYLLSVLLTLLLTVAYRASVVEMTTRGTDAFTSSRLGFAVTFGRGGFWKPLGLSVALALIYMVLVLAGLLAKLVLLALHVPQAWLDSDAVTSAYFNASLFIFNPYAIVCVALYVFEFSARSEGFFSGTAAAQPEPRTAPNA